MGTGWGGLREAGGGRPRAKSLTEDRNLSWEAEVQGVDEGGAGLLKKKKKPLSPLIPKWPWQVEGGRWGQQDNLAWSQARSPLST